MKNLANFPQHISRAMLETREELAPFLKNLDLKKLSRHNRGYLRYASNPTSMFIDSEMHNHAKLVAYLATSLPTNARIMEIGFFIPVIPIALSKLGFEVDAVEKLEFYEDSLTEIIAYSASQYNINIHNIDILQEDITSLSGQYDCVILSAILEHLNGSPRSLLTQAKMLGKDNAIFWISVPNAASLHKRLSMLIKGHPPFPPISDYYDSDYPFTGHNREYTITDLKYVLQKSGYEILALYGHNKALQGRLSLQRYMIHELSQILPESYRQSLVAIVRKKVAQITV